MRRWRYCGGILKSGDGDFRTYPDLAGTRSWRVRKPFHRFMIFYRIESGVLSAERLLEGHSRVAGGR